MNIVAKPSLPKVFRSAVNKQLLAQAVRVYLGNQRAASAHTKTRTEVAKTTKKMYKQKGTGRARHGSAAAPIFVGGGIAFGPTGTQNYTGRMPAAMKKIAVRSALAARAADKKITIVNVERATGKTAQAAKIVPARSLVIVNHDETKFAQACKNIKNVSITYPDQLNAYTILNNRMLVVSESALAEIGELYA